MVRKRSARKTLRLSIDQAARQLQVCEALEPRLMLTAVMINGTSGNDTINVFTGRVFTPRGILPTVDWTINGGATQSQIVTSGNDNVVVDTGGGQDTVNVQSTVAGVPTTVRTHTPTTSVDDGVNIGDSNGAQDIQGPVYVAAFGGSTATAIHDQGDTSARTVLADNGVVTGLAPATITLVSPNDQLNISTDTAGGNVVDCPDTGNMEFTVGQNSGDTVHLGSSTNGVAAVPYALIEGGAVTIDDSGDAGAQTFSIGVQVAGLFGVFVGNVSHLFYSANVTSWTIDGGSGGKTFNVNQTKSAIQLYTPPTTSISLNAGSGNDTVDVKNVDATATLNVLGGGGLDTVNVGNSGSVQNIAGNVTVSNSQGQTNLTIDDSQSSIASNATISDTLTLLYAQITGLAPGTIAWQVDNVTGAHIDGGSGGNTFAITGSPTPFPDITTLPIVLNTGSGNDTVAMNYATGEILANVVLQGGAGTNTLIVVGSGPTDTFGVTPTTITHLGQTTTYSNFNVMVLDPGMFTVSGDLNGTSLTATDPGTTVLLQGNLHLGTLTVDDGTKVTMGDGSSPGTLSCGIIVVRGSGKLDLQHNALQLNYAGTPDPVAAIRNYLASGAITSSFGDGSHALGLGDGADGVMPNLRPGTLLVRLTRVGDLNLDNTVNFADLLVLAQHYGESGDNWDQGDLNGDGRVSFPDLLALAQNYGHSAAAATPLAATPAAAALLLDRPVGSRRRRG